ncbi:MAG: glycosyltransferase [Anaerolineae bacterium]|nr:glycosyltransferase [Anaerolineae bacterium]
MGRGATGDEARGDRRVVVVIPTYNERENVEAIASAVLAEQAHVEGYELHVLIADSHSSDGTLEIMDRLVAENRRIHVLDVNERGIGLGLLRGFTHAIEHLQADVLIEMDADFQHNPADIPAFLVEIGRGYDLVVGSRFLAGSGNRMPVHRRLLSVAANQVIRIMLGLRGVTEITTSYRALTRETFARVPTDAVPWAERSFIPVPVFLVRMLEHGARAIEIPITMHPRTRGYSKMVYWKYIRDILRFSLRSRLGRGARQRVERA